MKKSKKKPAVILTLACICALSLCIFTTVGCSPSGSSSSGTETEAADNSLVAYHASIGQDISYITDVSYSTCSQCHGSVDEIVAKTDAMWEGIGQITDANPHDTHGTNAFECEDCHVLTSGPQVNQCNACHDFDTPDGWEEKSYTTTTYGVTGTEPLYTTYNPYADEE